MPTTTSVTLAITLNSAADPPYYLTGSGSLSGTVNYSDGTSSTFSGWDSEDIGTPGPGGASLTITVADSAWAMITNETALTGWALTFIPRPGTNQKSPIPNSSLSGSNPSGNMGTWTLISALNNAFSSGYSGYWDWSLMVQMRMAGLTTTYKVYVSDPEMEVDS